MSEISAACEAGDVATVRALLATDKELLEHCNVIGDTPLLTASYHGHLELMALCGDCMDALRECSDCGQRFRGRGKRCLECREAHYAWRPIS